ATNGPDLQSARSSHAATIPITACCAGAGDGFVRQTRSLAGMARYQLAPSWRPGFGIFRAFLRRAVVLRGIPAFDTLGQLVLLRRRKALAVLPQNQPTRACNVLELALRLDELEQHSRVGCVFHDLCTTWALARRVVVESTTV